MVISAWRGNLTSFFEVYPGFGIKYNQRFRFPCAYTPKILVDDSLVHCINGKIPQVPFSLCLLDVPHTDVLTDTFAGGTISEHRMKVIFRLQNPSLGNNNCNVHLHASKSTGVAVIHSSNINTTTQAKNYHCFHRRS